MITFKEVVEIEPRNVAAYLGIADAYVCLDKPEEAVAWLEKGIGEIEQHYNENGELEKDSHKLYIKGADILSDTGKPQEAADLLERGFNLTGDEAIQERWDEINKLLAVKPSLPEGVYDEPQLLTLSSKGGTIHYTLDGSIPNRDAPVYKEPILIDNGTVVVKAVTISEEGTIGDVYSFTYIVEARTE